MGQSLYETSPAARAALDTAERLNPGTLALCFAGSKEALSQTLNAACLMAVDYACAVALMEAGFNRMGWRGSRWARSPRCR